MKEDLVGKKVKVLSFSSDSQDYTYNYESRRISKVFRFLSSAGVVVYNENPSHFFCVALEPLIERMEEILKYYEPKEIKEDTFRVALKRSEFEVIKEVLDEAN